MGRFDSAGLVLEPVEDRAAALCRFAGHPAAADSPTALALVTSAVEFAEQLASVDDVAELWRWAMYGAGRRTTTSPTWSWARRR